MRLIFFVELAKNKFKLFVIQKFGIEERNHPLIFKTIIEEEEWAMW